MHTTKIKINNNGFRVKHKGVLLRFQRRRKKRSQLCLSFIINQIKIEKKEEEGEKSKSKKIL